MTAPAVVAAIAVAREGPAEIARGEGGDVVREPELLHRALEGVHALAEFRKEIGVGAGGRIVRAGCLAGVCVVAANLAKEDLSLHAEAAVASAARAGLDQSRDHLKLPGEAGAERIAARR